MPFFSETFFYGTFIVIKNVFYILLLIKIKTATENTLSFIQIITLSYTEDIFIDWHPDLFHFDRKSIISNRMYMLPLL